MRGKIRAGTVLMAAGALLLCGSVGLAVYNNMMDRRAADFADSIVDSLPEAAAETEPDENPAQYIPDYVLNPEMDMPETEIDGEKYIGVLEIPELGLRLQVMSEWSYPKLRLSPCRYFGSAYTGDLIIAAHNYKSHFGNLSKLAFGSPVSFTDVDGNRFSYVVKDIETLGGTDIEKMRSGEWDLTLFTCTYGGKTRVTVRCCAVSE